MKRALLLILIVILTLPFLALLRCRSLGIAASPPSLFIITDDIETALISLEDSDVFFDIDGDGVSQNIGWVTENAYILAVDINRNRIIDGGSETFLQVGNVSWKTDLVEMDSNEDGVIDEHDKYFSYLVLWHDGIYTGVSNPFEVVGAPRRIERIQIGREVENGFIQNGHQVFRFGTVESNSYLQSSSDLDAPYLVYEVIFEENKDDTSRDLFGKYARTRAAGTVPLFPDVGELTSTRGEVAKRPELGEVALDLQYDLCNNDLGTFFDEFDNFLFEWAEVRGGANSFNEHSLRAAFLKRISAGSGRVELSRDQIDEEYNRIRAYYEVRFILGMDWYTSNGRPNHFLSRTNDELCNLIASPINAFQSFMQGNDDEVTGYFETALAHYTASLVYKSNAVSEGNYLELLTIFKEQMPKDQYLQGLITARNDLSNSEGYLKIPNVSPLLKIISEEIARMEARND